MAFIRLDQEPGSFRRRRACLLLQADALIDWFKSMDGTRRERVTGVPADARVIGIETTPWYQGEPMIKVYLESDTFDEVPEGVMAPTLNLISEIIDEPVPVAVARG